MPAQLTRPWRPPYEVSAAATAACALAASATSVLTKRADLPSSAASAWPSASLRSAITALPPPATIMRTVPAPRPEAPPVTINVLPLKSMLFLRLDHRHRGRDEPGNVRHVGRNDQRVVGLREQAERIDVV